MRNSIKSILGIGIISGSLLFSVAVSADSGDKNKGSKLDVLNSELVTKDEAVKNLGKVEETKVESIDELKSIEFYNEEIKKVKNSIKELNELKEVYKTNKNTVLNDMVKINEEIEIAKNKIVTLEKHIVQKKESIEETKEKLIELYKEIEEMEKEKAERELGFRDRVHSIHQNKDITVIEVLMESNSFSDMVNRFFSYKTIVSADNQAIEDYLDLIKRLEAAKEKTEKLKDKLESDLKDLNEKREALKDETEAYGELLKVKERQSMSIDEIMKSIDADISKLNSSIEKININKNQVNIVSELNKRVAEERAKMGDKIYRYADLSGITHVSDSVAEEMKQGKIFVTPTTGRFTSGFGPRVVMGEYGFHRGIDFANKVGTSILASAEGKVIHASPMGGYGNVIFIKHNIDGRNYVTVYGHLSAYGVKVGDTVEQGQTIGLMGNTGRSTGPHLHFEIQEDTAKYNSSKAVDGWKYLTNKLNDGIVRKDTQEIEKIEKEFEEKKSELELEMEKKLEDLKK